MRRVTGRRSDGFALHATDLPPPERCLPVHRRGKAFRRSTIAAKNDFELIAQRCAACDPLADDRVDWQEPACGQTRTMSVSYRDAIATSLGTKVVPPLGITP
jgi:hypothetical protein